MLTDSRIVFHTDFKYVIRFFRSDHIFFYLTLKICEKITNIGKIKKINGKVMNLFQ